MAGLLFTCLAPRYNVLFYPNICFGNSSCTSTELTGEFCICTPDQLALGYSHDFTFGHQLDCRLPPNALLWGFIVCTLGTLFALFLLRFTYREATAEAVPLTVIMISFVVIVWATSLSVYVQNGIFEAGSVGFACVIVLTLNLFVRQVIFLIGPIYAIIKIDISTPSKRIKAVSEISFLILKFYLSLLLFSSQLVTRVGCSNIYSLRVWAGKSYFFLPELLSRT
jgi:hypothetical protein